MDFLQLQSPIIIGECIHTTGRPELCQTIEQGNYSLAEKMALEQVQEGAHIIDVNVSSLLNKEAEGMRAVVAHLLKAGIKNVSIDSSSEEVLAKGLEVAKSAALVNSVHLGTKNREKLLEQIAKENAAVVLMCLGQTVVPSSPQERADIGLSLYAQALECGISAKRIWVDPIVTAQCVTPNGAWVTLQTAKLIQNIGVNTIIGLSNVSYGMPLREDINAAFYKMAKDGGIGAFICNPQVAKVQNSSAAAQEFLQGGDALRFISYYRNCKAN